MAVVWYVPLVACSVDCPLASSRPILRDRPVPMVLSAVLSAADAPNFCAVCLLCTRAIAQSSFGGGGVEPQTSAPRPPKRGKGCLCVVDHVRPLGGLLLSGVVCHRCHMVPSPPPAVCTVLHRIAWGTACPRVRWWRRWDCLLNDHTPPHNYARTSVPLKNRPRVCGDGVGLPRALLRLLFAAFGGAFVPTGPLRGVYGGGPGPWAPRATAMSWGAAVRRWGSGGPSARTSFLGINIAGTSL